MKREKGWQSVGRAVTRLARVAAVGATVMAASASTGAAQVALVSETAANTRGNASSTGVSVSGDGRYIAFTSDATNLVAGDTNQVPDVFVKDRMTGTLTRVSVATGGTQAAARSGSPVISNNGRYVAFASDAAFDPADTDQCVPDNPVVSCTDVYVHDTQTGTTTFASDWADPIGARPRGISDDGRYLIAEGVRRPGTPYPGTRIDIYRVDLLNHTSTPIGTLGPSQSFQTFGRAAMNKSGTLIMFSTARSFLPAEPDPFACMEPVACQRVYAYDSSTSTITRVLPNLPFLAGEPNVDIRFLDMSDDGRFVLVMVGATMSPRPGASHYAAYVFDRTTGDTRRVDDMFNPERSGAVSDDGRTTVTCSASTLADGVMQVSDGVRLEPRPDQRELPACLTSVALSGDGRVVAFDSAEPDIVPGDLNAAADVFAHDRDADGDGMSTFWETRYGFDPASPGDAALDADGDGVTNAAEFLAGTHPRGTVKRYFAEGASNAFFQLAFSLFNPGTTPAVVQLTFLGQNGETTMTEVPLAAGEATTLRPVSDPFSSGFLVAPDAAFSTVLESDQPIVAERDMDWGGGSGYGSHAETAIHEPRTEWHFAEGATGRFSLFYLLQNPGGTPAHVTITYLLPAPAAPITHSYTVDPHSRRTIDINGEPGLGAVEVSARLTSDVPILAERAMYISQPGFPFVGGHEGAAVAEPATEWFVAEGATGFFSLYLTVENPGATDADIEVTYLLDAGAPIVRTHKAPKEGRLTIDVAGEDPRLLAATLGAIVRSTNGIPVVVERVMWWPRPEPYEATLTAGSRTTGLRWAASGVTSVPERAVETYLLIASPTGAAGTVTVRLRTHRDATTAMTCETTQPLPAQTRLTLSVAQICEGAFIPRAPMCATIDSTTPIVAERATYLSAPGTLWSGGAGVALTKLPDVP